MRGSAQKKCYFYAKIVKFGLILTYLKLFGGARKYFGGKCPPPPCPPLAAPPLRVLNVYFSGTSSVLKVYFSV